MRETSPARRLRTVLHPTDLTVASESAFIHALRIALAAQAKLYILNVESSRPVGPDWAGFPSIRKTLVDWGRLAPGSLPKDVKSATGIQLVKVRIAERDAIKAILGFHDDHPSDLIVLATHGREGLPRFLQGSVAEPVARRALAPTLFIPRGARGFVSRDSGDLQLRRLLLPADNRPRPDAALAAVGQLVDLLGQEVAIDLFHVGEAGDMPAVQVPDALESHITRSVCAGDPVEQILEAAVRDQVDLIAMATSGHDGILDAIRGSTTERVLRGAPCAVLAVPSP
jgi:nucleotide-binding universal stress UspA family protein